MSERISPFLVLGLDYGASPDEAERAFSQKVRVLRDTVDAPFAREDLTWALNAIQHPPEDLSTSVEYVRVPAGRADFGAPVFGELFCPAPIPLPRRTPPLTDDDRRAVLNATALRSMRGLFSTALPEPHNPYA